MSIPGKTKITLNLTPDAVTALDRLCAAGANKTDSINRALRLAAAVHQMTPNGCLVVVQPDGTKERIWIV